MLKCVSKYKSSLGSFVPGDIIDDLRLEVSLLLDSQESFAVVLSEEKEPEVHQAAIVEESPKGVLRKRRLIGD